MIGFKNLSDCIIEMNEFPIKWRFIEEKYNVLPRNDLLQLEPLNTKGARFLDNYIHESNLHEEVPFTKGFFEKVTMIEIGEDKENETRTWLHEIGIPLDQRILLSWNSDLAMIAPWGLVIKYFDDLFYESSDDLTIFDESLNWSVLFFHESRIYFGSNDMAETTRI